MYHGHASDEDRRIGAPLLSWLICYNDHWTGWHELQLNSRPSDDLQPPTPMSRDFLKPHPRDQTMTVLKGRQWYSAHSGYSKSLIKAIKMVNPGTEVQSMLSVNSFWGEGETGNNLRGMEGVDKTVQTQTSSSGWYSGGHCRLTAIGLWSDSSPLLVASWQALNLFYFLSAG